MRKKLGRQWGWIGLGCLLWVKVSMGMAAELTLALANSTCDAMSRVGELYRANRPLQLNYLCKSSGLLAKGLRGGALSADIFVSADQEWMDFAVENGLVERERVFSPWGNVLVVAVPKASPMRRLEWADLASDKVETILIGDPSNAPFGRHAKEALESSGLWGRVRHKIQTRKNVELLAESLTVAGPGVVGILFGTNLTGQLRSLFSVTSSLHSPIRYHVAPLKSAARRPEVEDFLKFLRSRSAREVFREAGFDLTPP